MEDALRELKALKKKAEELGLNPCSNGRCSARMKLNLEGISKEVS